MKLFLITILTWLLVALPIHAQCPSGGGGSGGNEIILLAVDAIMPDGTTGNIPTSNSRETVATTTGIDPFFYTLQYSGGDKAQWTFHVPANYSSAPILTFWGEGSSATGTQTFSASLRCVTPNNSEGWTAIGKSFDTANTPSAVGFSTFLDSFDITLTNNDSMAAGDLCTLDLTLNTTGNTFDFYGGVITYTAS